MLTQDYVLDTLLPKGHFTNLVELSCGLGSKEEIEYFGYSNATKAFWISNLLSLSCAIIDQKPWVPLNFRK